LELKLSPYWRPLQRAAAKLIAILKNQLSAVLARRQLYVAMTRAQEQLHLFCSGDASILHELRQSECFEVV
jgi:ATP-dependent exoDNAse (exonuclease V) beta subunit